ncbi:MAG: hypothetical protein ACK443_11315 [Methylococcaceae bacterium]|jgi:hypothetical protein
MTTKPKLSNVVTLALLASVWVAAPSYGHSSGDDHGSSSRQENGNHRDDRPRVTPPHAGTDDASQKPDDSASVKNNTTGGQTDDALKVAGGDKAPRLKAILSGTLDPTARGKIELESRRKGQKFEGGVKLVVPSGALNIADRAAAAAITPTLVLSRGGVPYAECDLDVTRFKRSSSGLIAEYKVKVAIRRGVLREDDGICDTDLSLTDAQPGVPAIAAGDTVEVTLDTVSGSVLQGTF